jgi:hypothetical protein
MYDGDGTKIWETTSNTPNAPNGAKTFWGSRLPNSRILKMDEHLLSPSG